MTRIRIKKLIWDEYNKEHIQKHKVSIEEVEIAGKQFGVHKKEKFGRYSIISRVRSRMLTVVINRLSPTIYYVVTARDSAKKERKRLYEKEEK